MLPARTSRRHNKRRTSLDTGATFQRARENGQRYNLDKCRFNYGHVISFDGMKPDNKKVEAIAKMAKAANKTEQKTILGMANYLAKFAPQLSDVTAPMRDILMKDFELVWDLQKETASIKMRDIVTRSPVLTFYDLKEELTLKIDASEKATSAALMQEGRPIEYMLRALDESEQN